VSAVSIQPGSTALTWMLSFAQADAHGLGELHDAALCLQRTAGANPAPKIDSIEPMLTILPAPAFFISG
jgi:hypothetical protein